MTNSSQQAWNSRYGEWLDYAKEVLAAVNSGTTLTLGPSATPLVPPHALAPSSSKPARASVVYCAPHPDDESLSGALALRLKVESGARVTNVAITLGSRLAERARRLRELESACRALDFELVVPRHPNGLDHINPEFRVADPQHWAADVELLSEIFDREQPEMVFAPHAEDFNSTHLGVHLLVTEALAAHLERTGRGVVPLVETEFWHQLAEPNLMVGVSPEVAAMQLVACAEHAGEMRRNPYHLLHLCRLMDNVRRGSEVVGGQGAAAQSFSLAELYRVTFIDATGGDRVAPHHGGHIIPPDRRVSLKSLREHFLAGPTQ